MTRPNGAPQRICSMKARFRRKPFMQLDRLLISGPSLNVLSGITQSISIRCHSYTKGPPARTSIRQTTTYRSLALLKAFKTLVHNSGGLIALTPPPLNPTATEDDVAARARAFANWLTSDEFLAGHPNVFTFDFFGLLAEGDSGAADYNMLRATYREGEDSHPNQLANETIGPRLADFIVDAVETYRAGLAEEGEGP